MCRQGAAADAKRSRQWPLDSLCGLSLGWFKLLDPVMQSRLIMKEKTLDVKAGLPDSGSGEQWTLEKNLSLADPVITTAKVVCSCAVRKTLKLSCLNSSFDFRRN